MTKDGFGPILRTSYKSVHISKWIIKWHLHDKEEHQFRILKWDKIIPSFLMEQTVMANYESDLESSDSSMAGHPHRLPLKSLHLGCLDPFFPCLGSA